MGFRTAFLPGEVRVRMRDHEGGAPELRLRLDRVGVGTDLEPVAPATLRAERHRAEYVRDNITEWYVNDPRGLEQGFTIQEPLSPSQSSATIRVELAVSGDLTPRLESADAVAFEHDGVTRLRYAGLRSWDVRGRDLPSRMELQTGEDGAEARLSLVVDATAAHYPITIDPIVTSSAWTIYGGEVGARFGSFAASAGDVNGDGYADILVGAPYYDGGQTDSGRESDGHLYQLDAATGTQVESVRLGDGSAAIGAPSLDPTNGLVFVGSDAGMVYAVQVPLP